MENDKRKDVEEKNEAVSSAIKDREMEEVMERMKEMMMVRKTRRIRSETQV